MSKTPAADGAADEAGVVGGVPGWWCRPADAVAGGVILYLHGGAYVVGSAQAYRHFAGQIAARAKAPAFVADYGLRRSDPFRLPSRTPRRPIAVSLTWAFAESRSQATLPAGVWPWLRRLR
jgi:hypothetical protein